MLNLARVGTAAVVGIGSGVLDKKVAPLKLSDTMHVSVGTVLEALAVVGGGLIQFMAPQTFPSVVDGAIDGGIALLAKRGTEYAFAQTGSFAVPMSAPYQAPLLGSGTGSGIGNGYIPGYANTRPQIGNFTHVPRVSLT